MDVDERSEALAIKLAVELGRSSAMDITLRPESALIIAGLLALALRHPHVPDSSREPGTRFLGYVREHFADCPTILEVLAVAENGWHAPETGGGGGH